MLPAGSRLRRRGDFVATLRSARGTRAAGLLVVHVARPEAAVAVPTRVGFVVSRSVGTAVVRNRVRRRLRHLAVGQIDRLPPGSRVVVRALPATAVATYDQLAAALRGAVDRAVAA